MNYLELLNYDLEQTLLGGQAFSWYKNAEGYYIGTTEKVAFKLKHQNNLLVWQTYPELDNFKYLRKYIRYDVDYPNIVKTIAKDKYINKAIEAYPNLRLLQQDLYQTIISFIISTNNNLSSIKGTVARISKAYGKEVIVDNEKVHLFPSIEALAAASLEDLQKLKLGYRAKYVKESAQMLLTMDLELKVAVLSEEELVNELLKLPGVGRKVVDCILLFGLANDTVTPIDVWGYRILSEYYGLNVKTSYNKLRQWLKDYFEGYAGWAGQFLFEYIRNNYKRKPSVTK
jgi:N-glycosylase/DNA lyase